MKKFINKTNQYLLENYPNIWNTRLVWVVLTCLIVHLIFFIFGFATFSNPESLHERGAKEIYFKNGSVFMNIILTILILVIWLSFLLKNNAFKSLYPLKGKQIFGQLLMYIIIIFSALSFYISYNYGIKYFIRTKYNDARVFDEIKKSNKASLFFSHNLENYTLDQRKYPAPFDTLYCSQINPNIRNEYYEDVSINEKIIDSGVPHLQFLDSKYYYYTLYKKIYPSNENQTLPNTRHVYYKIDNNLTTYYYKDTIFDITKITESAYPTYFNYSSKFYSLASHYNKHPYSYAPEVFRGEKDEFPTNRIAWNKNIYDFLKRNDTEEIKQVLTNFLKICDAYKIEHNLSTITWFELVYHPGNFELKSLIRKTPKIDYKYYEDDDKTLTEIFTEKHLTDYYIETDELYNLFRNVQDIKDSTPFLDTIHIFLWLSFLIAAIILMFRTTGLKAFIFTIVVTGVISIFIGLSASLFELLFRNHSNTEYFIMWLSLIILLVILCIPIILKNKLKKIIVGICLNLSLISFILLIILILSMISSYQEDYCYQNKIRPCTTVWESLGVVWSPILFIINLVILYFYTKVIKNWKALPEH